MTHMHTAPYGSWKSPIIPDLLLSNAINIGLCALDGEDTYWIEGRPSEGGRNVIVRRGADGAVADMTPPPFNARTRVHEYGGGDYVVSNGTLYFSNFVDQRLYRVTPGAEPEALTPEVKLRYADAIIDSSRDRLICVCDDHTNPEREAVNTLAGISLANGQARVLVAGNDFYSTPRLSPDGSRLCWLTWNHPNMPWDGTELWLGEIDGNGEVVNARCIAGGLTESIFQPQWSPNGQLYFISDRTGWWNIYRQSNGKSEALYTQATDFGVPHWVFGMSTYAFISPQRIICWYTQNGIWHLASL
ncbi:MAG: TolB family protein, partial [Ktedonobacteraceae bacterium]